MLGYDVVAVSWCLVGISGDVLWQLGQPILLDVGTPDGRSCFWGSHECNFFYLSSLIHSDWNRSALNILTLNRIFVITLTSSMVLGILRLACSSPKVSSFVLCFNVGDLLFVCLMNSEVVWLYVG